MEKKELKIDSRVLANNKAINELEPMICRFMVDQKVSLRDGMVIMASATAGLINTLCEVIGENPKEVLDSYVKILQLAIEEA